MARDQYKTLTLDDKMKVLSTIDVDYYVQNILNKFGINKSMFYNTQRQ